MWAIPEAVTTNVFDHDFQAELPENSFADLLADKDLILQTAFSEDTIPFKLAPLTAAGRRGPRGRQQGRVGNLA